MKQTVRRFWLLLVLSKCRNVLVSCGVLTLALALFYLVALVARQSRRDVTVAPVLVSVTPTAESTVWNGVEYGRHGFRRPNTVISDYDDNVADRLRTLVSRKATADDPELIRLIVDMMDPPSRRMVKMSRQLFSTPQSREVDSILQQKRGGFYVECGAFDGERASNTLPLERNRGWTGLLTLTQTKTIVSRTTSLTRTLFLRGHRRWTGLLVEMDPYFYTQLIGKSRRSWSINACLSPLPYVTQALMQALNRSTVDYFSLDVEGFELDVLRTIAVHEVNVTVLSVEYVHGRAGKQSYVDLMKQRGYVVHKDIHFHQYSQTIFVDDFIFVKAS